MAGPDTHAASMARLDALPVDGGVVHLLRMGMWNLALSDAVEANPWVTEEDLHGLLVTTDVPDPDATRLVLDYPVAFGIDGHGELAGRALEGSVAYGRISSILDATIARHGPSGPATPEAFHAVVADGLRCAWLTTQAAGTLTRFADFLASEPDEPEACDLLDEVSDLRRQARAAAEWCAETFAARWVQRHGVEPAVAVELAMALGAVDEGQLATPTQLFPPRLMDPWLELRPAGPDPINFGGETKP